MLCHGFNTAPHLALSAPAARPPSERARRTSRGQRLRCGAVVDNLAARRRGRATASLSAQKRSDSFLFVEGDFIRSHHVSELCELACRAALRLPQEEVDLFLGPFHVFKFFQEVKLGA